MKGTQKPYKGIILKQKKTKMFDPLKPPQNMLRNFLITVSTMCLVSSAVPNRTTKRLFQIVRKTLKKWGPT